jgi:hypothetical protein
MSERESPPGPDESTSSCESRPACPACGGRLIEIRAKFHCEQCHRLCETCCEGGRVAPVALRAPQDLRPAFPTGNGL